MISRDTTPASSTSSNARRTRLLLGTAVAATAAGLSMPASLNAATYTVVAADTVVNINAKIAAIIATPDANVTLDVPAAAGTAAADAGTILITATGAGKGDGAIIVTNAGVLGNGGVVNVQTSGLGNSGAATTGSSTIGSATVGSSVGVSATASPSTSSALGLRLSESSFFHMEAGFSSDAGELSAPFCCWSSITSSLRRAARRRATARPAAR